MGRVKQNPAIYIALFVTFFALFAREHQRLLRIPSQPVAPVARAAPEEIAAPVSKQLREFSEALQADPLVQAHADGLSVAYRPESVLITFSGEEVYSEGSFAMRETWFTALDRVGALVKPFMSRGLKAEIVGYTDVGSLRERRPSDYGESDFAFSFARAEWVARFMERRALIPIREKVKLTGAGAVKAGRKVELNFTFN